MSSNQSGMRDDLTGKRFWKLTVIKPLFKRHRAWIWLCKCDCGNETTGIGAKIKNGLKKSCGCYKTDVFVRNNLSRGYGKEHPYWKGHGEISGSLWSVIKASAIRRKLPFEITIEYAWDMFLKQDRKCALSGVPIFFCLDKQNISRKHTASLDRIDSAKGYVEGNVQWVHSEVNYMKFRFDQDKFLNWCQVISAHQHK